jgi:hypothetical protein
MKTKTHTIRWFIPLLGGMVALLSIPESHASYECILYYGQVICHSASRTSLGVATQGPYAGDTGYKYTRDGYLGYCKTASFYPAYFYQEGTASAKQCSYIYHIQWIDSSGNVAYTTPAYTGSNPGTVLPCSGSCDGSGQG